MIVFAGNYAFDTNLAKVKWEGRKLGFDVDLYISSKGTFYAQVEGVEWEHIPSIISFLGRYGKAFTNDQLNSILLYTTGINVE